MKPYSVEQYRSMLQGLLPQGLAWSRERDSVLSRLLHALAGELHRVDAAAHGLIAEAGADTALALLPDWERVCGLPDECSLGLSTLAERRAALLHKLTARGGQSRAYFEELASAFAGQPCTVREFRPFRVGMSRCGDPLSGGDWAFTWRVHVPSTVIREFRCGQSCAGDPLRSWGNERLECIVRRLAPAHTLVQFSYGGDA